VLTFGGVQCDDEHTFEILDIEDGAVLYLTCDEPTAINVRLSWLPRAAPDEACVIWHKEEIGDMKHRVLRTLLGNDDFVVDDMLTNCVWFMHIPAPWFQIRREVNPESRRRLPENDAVLCDIIPHSARLVLELKRRELTPNPYESGWGWIEAQEGGIFGDRSRNFMGSRAIHGKFLTPIIGEVPAGVWVLAAYLLMTACTCIVLFGDTRLTKDLSAMSKWRLETVGLWGFGLPSMVMCALPCCRSDSRATLRGRLPTFGPLEEMVCGCQPAVWWLSLTILLSGIGIFSFWTVDCFYHDAATDTIEIRARSRIALTYIGQFFIMVATVMSWLAVRWHTERERERVNEAAEFDYNRGDLADGLPQPTLVLPAADPRNQLAPGQPPPPTGPPPPMDAAMPPGAFGGRTAPNAS